MTILDRSLSLRLFGEDLTSSDVSADSGGDSKDGRETQEQEVEIEEVDAPIDE